VVSLSPNPLPSSSTGIYRKDREAQSGHQEHKKRFERILAYLRMEDPICPEDKSVQKEIDNIGIRELKLIHTGRTRCFPFWQEFSKCYAKAETPAECIAQKEDYMECLHRTKEVSSCSIMEWCIRG